MGKKCDVCGDDTDVVPEGRMSWLCRDVKACTARWEERRRVAEDEAREALAKERRASRKPWPWEREGVR